MLFDEYPAYYKVGLNPHPTRLAHRYERIIDAHRAMFADASVLDLGCNSGRWSFAALHAGASRVVGIDWDAEMAETAQKLCDQYEPPGEWTFLHGDFMEYLQTCSDFDVVLCCGVLYHTYDHYMLFRNLHRVSRALIVDTEVCRADGAMCEVSKTARGIEARPSWKAIQMLLNTTGWGEPTKVDLPADGIPHCKDYASKFRRTFSVERQ